MAIHNSKNSNNSKDEDIPRLPVIGEINPIYDVQKTTEVIILLGKYFKKHSDLFILMEK